MPQNRVSDTIIHVAPNTINGVVMLINDTVDSPRFQTDVGLTTILSLECGVVHNI